MSAPWLCQKSAKSQLLCKWLPLNDKVTESIKNIEMFKVFGQADSGLGGLIFWDAETTQGFIYVHVRAFKDAFDKKNR